jgi:Flp pilus assembly protein TadG
MMQRRHRESGAAAVEMAIILPVLILLVGGIVDFGRAFYTQVVLTNAAREGTRYALALEDPTASASAIQARAYEAAKVVSTSTNTPTATFSETCSTDDQMQVAVSMQFNYFFLTLVPGISNPTTVTGTSVMGCK